LGGRGKRCIIWIRGKNVSFILDPCRTLETIGESDLGGLLRGGGPLAAHYRVFTDNLTGKKR
jgi:hypothetical protein